MSIDYAAIGSVPMTLNNRPLAPRAERVVLEARIADVDEGQILLGDTGQMGQGFLGSRCFGVSIGWMVGRKMERDVR